MTVTVALIISIAVRERTELEEDDDSRRNETKRQPDIADFQLTMESKISIMLFHANELIAYLNFF